MVKVNRCTGEVEYANGCTSSGYICCTLGVLALCCAVPIMYTISFSTSDKDPLSNCLPGLNMTEDDEELSSNIYFRWEVERQQECNFEEKVLRGCDDTDPISKLFVMKFKKYPPGALRKKFYKDLKEEYDYIRSNFEAAPGGETSCTKNGGDLTKSFTALTSTYDKTLSAVAPFDAILGNKTISYPTYMCLALIDRVLVRLAQSAKLNGHEYKLGTHVQDYVTKVMASKNPSLCYLEEEDGCYDKDTKEGHEKQMDLGYDKCDFVEYVYSKNNLQNLSSVKAQ